ncbi:MAG TPA: hypothetical protein VH637_13565 [Streptosporangiaceae bacterium]|jgi:hypothetical protein
MTNPSKSALARIGWLALPAAAVLLGACSSAAHPAAHGPGPRQAACNQVSGALADGPDSDTDPVGYAQAQIIPLSQVRTSDSALAAAVARLDRAYRQIAASNAVPAAARQDVATASKQINAICPGAAS